MVPLQTGDSTSTLTVQDIKRRHQASDTWVSPHYGDGGWHETPGRPGFDPLDLIPLRDRILVRIFTEKLKYERIIRPETAAVEQIHSRRGVILKVGPGRWFDGDFLETEVAPGMEVIIGPHHDYQSVDAGWVAKDGTYICLCQEADIRVIVGGPNGATDGSSS
jgi:co-chaperonin GroES (HSP10)